VRAVVCGCLTRALALSSYLLLNFGLHAVCDCVQVMCWVFCWPR
jgi:hypothetical protein